MNSPKPHFLEAISNYSPRLRYDSGRTKVPSPLIERHRVVTFFHVVGQGEIPTNIQIIPWETETGNRIPKSDKADFGS